MGRFFLGVGLLAVLLGLGFWVAFSMNELHQPIAETLETAAQHCLSGDMETGVALAQKARQHWDDHWRRTASVADHSPMDEIDGLFAQMEVYAQTGTATEFAAHCARISKLIEAVGEAHSLSWWNLL